MCSQGRQGAASSMEESQVSVPGKERKCGGPDHAKLHA